MKDSYFIKSVIRGFCILEHIADTVGGEATVRGLSRSFGISETATMKILRTLETRSFVERDTPAGPYRLGYGTLMLREAYLQHRRKQTVRDVRPSLESVAGKTGETAYLALLGKGEPVCEDMVESTQPVRVVCRKGMPFPLEKTAVGKVMLAYTRGAIKFRREIEERGYAVSMGEFDPEVTAIAVPVRNHAGAVTAVLGIVGPSYRLGPERLLTEVAPVLVLGAKEVSRRLGFLEHPVVPPIRLKPSSSSVDSKVAVCLY